MRHARTSPRSPGTARGHSSASSCFGVVLIFVQIPGESVVYSVVGLVIFAGLTAYDFQRLRRVRDIREAPLLAVSIFLDLLNVFLLFLGLFGND